jgi:NAD(P)-dependent dehydrogenase (short-subunit alcohol dehydrogenase family)
VASQTRVAFITGASSGIGRAAAEAFVRAGYSVGMADRDEAGGREALDALSPLGDCRFIRCDVAEEPSVRAAVDATVEAYGRLDAAFNAAGVDGERAPITEASDENWHRLIAINLTGVYYCMRHELRHMVEQGSGSIVNCASSAGLVGTVMLPAYVAAKHGVVGLTRASALDYARKNIRINAVCPGMIDTPMWRRAISPELTAELMKSDPTGRLGAPSEIAQAALWLCSEGASFVNGQALAVDGGLTTQ